MDLNRVGFSINRKPQPPAPAEKPFEQAVGELVYMRGVKIVTEQWDQSATTDPEAVERQAYGQIAQEIIALDPNRPDEGIE
jgi:hypothetical protein